MKTKTPSLAYRPDIDGLRAFAVLAVVAYHAFPVTLKGGFIGVDVFFVISGYLISGIILNDLQQGTFSLWNFYSRRIRRIFPALIVVLAAVLIFGWFALFPDEYRALGKHVFGGTAFIANLLLWQEAGYFDAAAKAKPLLHLWSLGIEEQFYIVFPLLLWFCAKKHLRIATVIIVLCILSFLDNLYFMADPPVNFYNPLARAWELLAGAVLCTVMRHPAANGFSLKLGTLAGTLIDRKREKTARSLSLALALFGVILLGCALWLVRDDRPYPGWQALLPVSGTIFLIAAGPLNLINKHLLANRFAIFTGLVSYPFYLWHWVLISYAFIINGGLDASTRFSRVGLVAASFVLAVLTYLLVEKPVRFSAWARTEKIYALIIGMVVVGGVGLSVYLMDGLPERGHIFAIAKQLENSKQFVEKAGLSYANLEKGMLTYCKYTDIGADETVAIIGDSHATSAYEGIAKLGREIGYNTVLLGWIIPAGQIWNWNQDDVKNIPVVLDVLKRKKDIRKVFICTRGMLYITGVRVFLEKIPLIEMEKEKNHSVGYAPFKKSLQSYVDILREYGKEVFIISENPELTDTPRNYIDRPFNLAKKGKILDVCKVDVIKRQEKYLQLLSEIRNATIIDTIGPFCPDGKCLVFTEDGLPMYFDDDHLSPIGSDFQAERILRPYLTGEKNNANFD